MAGTARLDNKKFRSRFGTSHACSVVKRLLKLRPPGRRRVPLRIGFAAIGVLRHLSQALRRSRASCRATNSAVRIDPVQMVELTGAVWIDVAKM